MVNSAAVKAENADGGGGGVCVSPFDPPVGKPVIASLTKRRALDGNYKVLTCVADGAPEPSFQWNINSTDVSLRTRACT